MSLDLAALIAMLNEGVFRIVLELEETLLLQVRGLDLRPRLPTERTKMK